MNSETRDSIGDIEHIMAERSFSQQVIQPALAGLMDGSISTLAPLFAAAFVTRDPRVALIVGLSAALGAGISMAFAEALSETHSQTRAHPVVRGSVVGCMTFVGGILHTLPFLLDDIHTALYVAFAVAGLELVGIAYIRYHYFNLGFWTSVLQVVFGGGLVILSGILIGSI